MTSNHAAADALGCVLKRAVGGAATVSGSTFIISIFTFLWKN